MIISIFTKINLIGKIKETSFFTGTAGCSIPENTMDMNCSQTGCIIYTLKVVTNEKGEASGAVLTIRC
jgi:hypothetical protein